MAYVDRKASVIAKKLGISRREIMIEGGIHAVDIFADSNLDVILLPIHGGILVNALLLMEETISRLDAVSRENGLIVTLGAELLLLEAVDVSMSGKTATQFGRIGIEVVAERFERIKLLVTQEHVDAGNENSRVLGQMVHRFIGGRGF